MNYLNLSVIQKYDIFFTTLLFILFFLILRPLFLTGEISSNKIIALGLIFFVTFGMTFIFTNSVSFNKIYSKLKSENI
mgnify:CR=1 FL=1|jgi:hypothetical protein